MVYCAIFLQEFWPAVACVMWMRKAKVNEEWIIVIAHLSLLKVFQNLFGVPRAAFFITCSSSGAIMAYCKKLVCRFVTVAIFACPHGVVPRVIEDGW